MTMVMVISICRMGWEDEPWRQRLAKALVASGKSKRGASLEAGLGPSYLSGILEEGKQPKLSKVGQLCEVLGISLDYLVYGPDGDEHLPQILEIWKQMSPEEQQGLLRFLESLKNTPKK